MREPEIALAQSVRIIDGSTKVYNDPLLWWKVHEHRYPTIARLARKYLAIPATSVPSESLFSTAGRLVNKARARLGDSVLEACLIIFHNWEKVMGAFDPEEPLVCTPLCRCSRPTHNTISPVVVCQRRHL
jgi:hypothetical protein